MSPIHIVGFVGSLRAGSFNAGLMNHAQEVLPKGTTLTVLPIGDLPLFNQDIENNMPDHVRQLKKQVEEADAVLFASPEYNYSFSGVLKNAIDWLSRPYGKNSFEGKPVGIMGASPAGAGTARAQHHLRQVCVFLDCHVLNRPEVQVPMAMDKFDAEGNLTDEKSRAKVKELVEALVAWTERLKE